MMIFANAQLFKPSHISRPDLPLVRPGSRPWADQLYRAHCNIAGLNSLQACPKHHAYNYIML